MAVFFANVSACPLSKIWQCPGIHYNKTLFCAIWCMNIFIRYDNYLNFFVILKININSCSTLGRVEGWHAMKLLLLKVCAGRLHLTHHHRGVWNETNERGENVEWNLWQGEAEKTTRKTYWDSISPTTKPTRGVRDANSGDPAVGGGRLTTCATKPPL